METALFILIAIIIAVLVVILSRRSADPSIIDPANIDITHDPEWLYSIAVELQCYYDTARYIENKNQVLDKIQLPLPVEEPGSAKIEMLLRKLEKTLTEDHLNAPLQNFHFNDLPFLNIRRKNRDALQIIRNRLQLVAPELHRKIKRSWQKGNQAIRKGESFSKAISVFWQQLHKATSGNSPAEQKLHQFLHDSLIALIREKSHEEQDNPHFLTIDHTPISSSTPIIWGAVIVGISAYAIYDIHFEEQDVDFDPDTVSGPASLEQEEIPPLVSTFDNFQWSDSLDVSFPLVSSVLDSVNAIRHVHQNRLTLAEALTDTAERFAIRTASYSFSAWAGKMFSKTFTILQNIPNVVAIGVFIVGRVISRAIIKQRKKSRYKKAKAAYDEAIIEREKVMDEAYNDYYDMIYSLIVELNGELKEDCKTLALKPFSDTAVRNFITEFTGWLEKDIELARQRQAAQQEQETRLYDEINNFIIYAQKLITKLEHADDATGIPQILYNFKTMPIVKYGYVWANKQQITHQAYAISADNAIGLINWIHAIHGIYQAAINQILQENDSQNSRLYNLQRKWVIRIEKLRQKMLFRKQAVDNH